MAREKPRETAFVFLPEGDENEEQITYQQLDARARMIARQLTTQNLAGERALLLYPPGLDFVTALFGCLYAGVVAVPGFPPRRNRNMLRIQAIADDAQAAVALTTADVAGRADTFFDEAPHLEKLMWLATDVGRVADVEQIWRPVRAEPDAGINSCRSGDLPHASDLAILQYTSGSTGMPKGVMLTHGNLTHNVSLIAHAFAPRSTGLGVFWLPTYHDMGLVGGILNPLYCGRPSVLMPPMAFLARPVRWLQTITRWRAMISGGPNFAYQLCVDRISEQDCDGLDLSCWQVAYNGAEPVRADTIEAFTKKFAPYGFQATAHYPCYGLAEATLFVAGGQRGNLPRTINLDAKALAAHHVEPPQSGQPTRKVVGSGQAMPGTEIVVADPNTQKRLPDGHVGEVWIRSDSVAAGYWNQPEASEATFGGQLAEPTRSGSRETFGARTLTISATDGANFLRTGDLGFLRDGELFVTGRLKDLIIVHGVNRYPHDIEHSVQHAHPRLQTGAAAAFGFELNGQERLVVACEVQRRRHDDWTEAISAIRGRVAADQGIAPDAVVLVRFGSLPKTSSGKLQRHLCRDAFADGTLRVVSQWRSWADSDAAVAWATWDEDESIELAGDIDPSTARLVLDQVRTVARERAGELSLDTNIVDLGLDSLERMEIVAALEDTFGGRLPNDVMAEAETCREVIIAVQTYLSKPGTLAATPDASEIVDSEKDFAEMEELQQLAQRAAWLDELGVANPFFQSHDGIAGATTTVDGRELINFASYNYLGMSGDPVVSQAAKDAIDRWGTSVSASRLVSGERPIHRQLEQAIAETIGAEDSIVFIGGHATNESTIGHLFGPGDLVLHDALAHNSIIQGALLSGARRRSFPHNDWVELDRLLARVRHEYRRVLIAVEGVYGMDGDVPDIPALVEVKRRHGALLLVDEAHSLGTIGRTGRGVSEHFQLDAGDVDLWMGTLSKSLGSCGGYIAGGRQIVEYLRYTAPGFVYSVGISPANAAAALASIRQMERHPERVAKLQSLAKTFVSLARKHGLNIGRSAATPVIPVILKNPALTVRASAQLLGRGINVRPLLPPAVEENAARLRFFLTCEHTEEQIRQGVAAVAACLADMEDKAIA